MPITLAIGPLDRQAIVVAIQASLKDGCPDLTRTDVSIVHAVHELCLKPLPGTAGLVNLVLDDEEQVVLFSVLDYASTRIGMEELRLRFLSVMSRLSSDGRWDDKPGRTITEHQVNGDACSCGSDTCLCQECGKVVCGTLSTWCCIPSRPSKVGNVCHGCQPKPKAQGSVKSFRDKALSMNRQEFCRLVIDDHFERAMNTLAESYGCMTRDFKREEPFLRQTSNEDLTAFFKLSGVPLRITLGNYTHLAYVAGETWDFHRSNAGYPPPTPEYSVEDNEIKY